MMRITSLAIVGALLAAPTAAFELSFEWGDIPLCTTGSPNVVDNPRFTITGAPEGTKVLIFKLKDFDAPNYNHGGGTVEWDGSAVIEPGAFEYKSPCPPGEVHTYQWTVSAKEKDSFFSSTLGEAKAQRKYPE